MAEPGKATIFSYVEIPFAYLLQALGTTEPVTFEDGRPGPNLLRKNETGLGPLTGASDTDMY